MSLRELDIDELDQVTGGTVACPPDPCTPPPPPCPPDPCGKPPHHGGPKGNNGYGNGGHDGSPNGKQDHTR